MNSSSQEDLVSTQTSFSPSANLTTIDGSPGQNHELSTSPRLEDGMLPELNVNEDNGFGDFGFNRQVELDYGRKLANFSVSPKLPDVEGTEDHPSIRQVTKSLGIQYGARPTAKENASSVTFTENFMTDEVVLWEYRERFYNGSSSNVFSKEDFKNIEKRLEPEAYNRMKLNYETRAKREMHAFMKHPRRSSLYYKGIPKTEESSCAGQSSACGFVSTFPPMDWLRLLSHVNRVFRDELAKVMWSQSTIEANWDIGGFPKALVEFIQDAPAAVAHVRKISFGSIIQCVQDPSSPDSLDDIDRGFKLMASRLNLKVLEIRLYAHAADIEDVITTEGRHSTIMAIRNLVVTERINLHLSIFASCRAQAEDIEYQKLESKYQPILRDLMMPDTLRNAETRARSEQQKYLEDRLKA
ncbi:hypothetical protein GLAREA_02051 [Glarea lozoyensis ATCC 20868]|uniref:Uncharacterized protein n=1 Tax=Glarea lozoyensis (strain ATCC 20868 / MF5171) TaxID=1116229 RepID=S3CLR1_GLAL2|nr:uncharacterized protein GLAREA_02051 [Glarea lozoyensis ATCC 20868]EPE26139.1 hypothetical protein GLAREA_02051 [Glarea lozoyensis ATCC 20868]